MTKNFGEWLSEQIALLPATQVDFARSIGVSIHTLNVWLRPGTRGVRADHITRIAIGLKISRSELEETLEKFLHPKPSRRRKVRRSRPMASTEPLPATASAMAGV